MVVEVKKPEAITNSLENDKRKLPCMMKIMLDQLLASGVQDPVVIGFLVNGMFHDLPANYRPMGSIFFCMLFIIPLLRSL